MNQLYEQNQILFVNIIYLKLREHSQGFVDANQLTAIDLQSKLAEELAHIKLHGAK